MGQNIIYTRAFTSRVTKVVTKNTRKNARKKLARKKIEDSKKRNPILDSHFIKYMGVKNYKGQVN